MCVCIVYVCVFSLDVITDYFLSILEGAEGDNFHLLLSLGKSLTESGAQC